VLQHMFCSIVQFSDCCRT